MSPATLVNEASRCMKCGFCTSACPVYSIDHIESHVARGRNVLIRWSNEGTLPADDGYAERLSYCLLCGRCETNCPVKVPSPEITVAARAGMVAEKGLSWRQRLVYRGILKNRPLMARLLGLAARLPGMSVRNGRPLRHLPDFAQLFTKGLTLPAMSRPFLSKRLSSDSSENATRTGGTVAIFPGCAFEFFFADMGENIASALEKAGFQVVYPKGLTCCGLAVRAAGDIETARLMAQHNIDILSSFDQVVTGCATCYSTLKDYGQWFPEESPWRAKAKEVSAKMRDLSQFLVTASFQPEAIEPVTVTWHDPCHLKWHQGIADEPRKLLRAIPGVEYREMDAASECCGLGGAFSLKHRDISLALQAKKMESLARTGAQVVVTSCPGCLIQLRDGVRRHNLPVEVMHISQLLLGQTVPPRKPR